MAEIAVAFSKREDEPAGQARQLMRIVIAYDHVETFSSGDLSLVTCAWGLRVVHNHTWNTTLEFSKPWRSGASTWGST